MWQNTQLKDSMKRKKLLPKNYALYDTTVESTELIYNKHWQNMKK